MNTRLERLLALHEEDSKSTFTLFALAKEYEKMENLPLARHFYKLLEQADENYVGLYYHLGKLHVKLGDISEAIDVYKKGISIAQKLGDRHAWSELAQAKLEVDDE